MWPLLYYYLLGFSLFCSIILFEARTLKNVWFLDVIVSFLPLVTIGTLFVFVVSFIATIVYFKKLSRQKAKRRKWLIGFILLASLSSPIASIIQITNVLDNTVLAQERDLMTSKNNTLHVGFFNKYFYNEELDPIIDEVTYQNFDIFGMAELSEAQFNTLKEAFAFPYSYYDNCHCFNIMGDPVAIFSHYPLTNIKIDGLDRTAIIEATVTLDDSSQVHVLVTHPDAPTNIAAFTARNREYQELDTLIQNYREQQVIVLGDFNLSSWSPTFIQFLEQNPFLKDSVRGFGLPTTWGPGFIRTKIDHILISKTIGVSDFSSIFIPGSDHYMVTTTLHL